MSDLRGTIASITKSVTKTSGDLLKTTKLNMNLSTEEGNLRNLHLEIGKKVHEIYQYGGSLGKYFDDKYLEIEACERKISNIKEQISIIKGVRSCPKCNKTVERAAEFCPKCGIRLEVKASEADTVIPEPAKPIEAPAPQPYHPPQPKDHHHPDNILNKFASAPPPVPPAGAAWDLPSGEAFAPRPTITCRVCEAKNELGTKFCLSCGRILD